MGTLVKKLIVASVTCVALAAGHTALAADMLTKPIPPALILNLTGCYIGGNVGYGVGLDESIEFRGSFWDGFFSTNQFPRSIPVNLKGVIGGGQIGCNLQIQQWVVGVEADLQGTQIKGSNTLTPTPAAGAPFVTTGSENRRRFGTVRARSRIAGAAAGGPLRYWGFRLWRDRVELRYAGNRRTRRELHAELHMRGRD